VSHGAPCGAAALPPPEFLSDEHTILTPLRHSLLALIIVLLVTGILPVRLAAPSGAALFALRTGVNMDRQIFAVFPVDPRAALS
jgi:hypothetical protein